MSEAIENLRHNWGWMLTFGVILLLWGIFAVAYSIFFTAVSIFVIAWLLIIGGAIEAIHALRHHERHVILYFVEAILAIVAGALLLRSPAAGALVITLLLASYFIVSGIVRVVAAFALRMPQWGWTMFSGLLAIALGVLVWGGWPATAFWVLGVFVGVNLIFIGWSRIIVALALRGGHLPLSHPTPI
ncbi:MAG TPA: HdeD family acid-resistance protein [Bryobacteraceae bacterium]|nr:HdeD family acid-resistance protein [Bryobacteraceae bacterium]